jgi:hypothetical protein
MGVHHFLVDCEGYTQAVVARSEVCQSKYSCEIGTCTNRSTQEPITDLSEIILYSVHITDRAFTHSLRIAPTGISPKRRG